MMILLSFICQYESTGWVIAVTTVAVAQLVEHLTRMSEILGSIPGQAT